MMVSVNIVVEVASHKPITSLLLVLLFNSPKQHILQHTHPFNGRLSRTTRVGRYQKGKTNLDFTEARDSGWQWHQLGHMQVCTSLQTDNHVSTSLLKFFTGRMPFLPPNQQRQSTEGTSSTSYKENIKHTHKSTAKNA